MRLGSLQTRPSATLRKTIVMPVGGGIVANTFGLAAGLLFRGIRLVQCPTSFLNAHDAAASSQKQAINHAGYKNIVHAIDSAM